MGIASGADLPISLTVVSHDAPDEKTSASLVSSTQIFWQIGIFISYICSFLLSGVNGVLGARIVFVILLVFSIFAWVWRDSLKKFRMFHEEGAARQSALNLVSNQQKISLKRFLVGIMQKFIATFSSLF